MADKEADRASFTLQEVRESKFSKGSNIVNTFLPADYEPPAPASLLGTPAPPEASTGSEPAE